MKKYIIILLAIIQGVVVYAQTSNNTNFLPNIVPPSPIAYELGKYGNVPTGLFTGSTNISIPLYTYKSKSLELPITMFYNNSGIRVDATSGVVGLGWNLNCGGIISRMVRDKDDDGAAPKLRSSASILSVNQSPEKYYFYRDICNEQVDSEPDLYSFNFNGNSGQFIFDRNNNIMMLKNSKIKIERVSGGFVATSLEGIKYFFLDAEFTTMRSGESHQSPQQSITSWTLTKIVHPNGDQINFTYEEYNYIYTASQGQSMYFPVGGTNNTCGVVPVCTVMNLGPVYDNLCTVKAKRVIQISSNDSKFGSINFSYPFNDPDIERLNKLTSLTIKNESKTIIEQLNFSYQNSLNKRTFLNQITFLDSTKKYSFGYIDSENFPSRLSLAQDSWGYYNSKSNNSNIIPKGFKDYGFDGVEYGGADKEPNENYAKIGMLNKIIYPTKGYTELEYESNDYYGSKTIYPSLTISPLTVSNDANTMSTTSSEKIILSPVDQLVKISGTAFFNSNCNPLSNTGFHNIGTLSVINLEDNTLMEFSIKNGLLLNPSGSTSFTLSSSNSDIYFAAQANKNYKIILSINYRCIQAFCNISYYNTSPTTILTNIVTGGIRVKKTIDNNNNNGTNIKHFYYSTSLNNLTISSGKLATPNPNHIDIKQIRNLCNIPYSDSPGPPIYYIDQNLGVATSSSLISLYDDEGSNVKYTKVIESIGGDNFENGAIEHNFQINANNGAFSFMGPVIWSSPNTNSGWNNGNEFSTISYKNNFIKTSEKTFNFILDSRNTSEYETVFSGRENFSLIISDDLVHNCTQADINNSRSPCYQKPLGYIVYNLKCLENLSISMYDLQNNWSYLNSSVEKIYDNNGQNPVTTTTNYNYDNPLHIQLTSQTTTNSFGQTLETKYFYPDDLITEPFMSDLKTANRISTPIKTESWKNGIKISEQKTQYAKDATTGNLLLPKSVYTAKFPNVLPSILNVGNLEKKITFNQYDDKGNINQYIPENGIPVSIIWGYNKTQPIAKIENATYDSISATTITNLQNLSNTGTEADLINALNILRNSFPNSMVTTYTHKPLIGVSTITDAKGDQINYFYDTFNRLQNVKDKNGNILTENQYNYRP